MGGFFGVATKSDCSTDLFFGTDYHSHLGTRRGGMIVHNGKEFVRRIHDISAAQFRPKFQDDLPHMTGNIGIGVISDYEDQPVAFHSHLGTFAIVSVGAIKNAAELSKKLLAERAGHFTELADSDINQTELVAALINQEEDIVSGISRMQEEVVGSCSLLLLTDKGIYAARDKLGRTPIVLGQKDGGYCATFESSAMINLDYKVLRELGPGEIVFITPDGVEQLKAPGKKMRICTFLWVYFGFPSSCYEGVNAELYRYKCGASMAMRDDVEIDMVAGVPDSGTGSSIGYANQKGVPFGRPFVKYTPTWPRSFMPPNQSMRDLVARMKLQPIESLIRGKRLLFCEDSIVRGTQLQDTVTRVYACGAKAFHMRPSCPPLMFGCKYLNFSRSKGLKELAGRKAMFALQGDMEKDLDQYVDTTSDKHQAMIDCIRRSLNLSSLKYLSLEELTGLVGIPEENLCTYCWNGKE
jgi:amidophosphoribosyltransferase